ncbi:hypothetical protein VFPFJ_05889 [Purpureocillium lilacinum]|uniref:Uncharacterized protein n=1 Tax=Purpureocillium lilacinum TaxID=33203 RepID=A0A179HIM5_PURLI|nr:hypothetical protein VFPFJ_05889 [Purpureocillium lilacinum]OAQ89478.1 hypothetical protein VFPFJ_05889 [Purpureocillium lilacinum]
MESREDTSNILDPWPTSTDGTEWDGRGLLGLVQQGLDPFGNPFRGKLDTRALFVEIEQCLESTIVDIPLVSYGAHYFGFHVVLKSRPDVVVRVSRGDTCNRAYRESDTQQIQLLDSQFELDVYRTLVPLGTPFNRRPEEGAVVPALLSEPKMIVTADLVLNEHLEPSTRRCGDGDTPEKMAEYTSWSREYYEV